MKREGTMKRAGRLAFSMRAGLAALVAAAITVVAFGASASAATTPPRIAIIHHSDHSMWVKEGSLSAPCTKLTDNVTQVVLSGDRIAVVHINGTVAVKEGSLSAAWTTVANGAFEVA